MSHYIVAVIHRADQKIEDLLDPYDENKEVEPYIEFSKDEAIEYGKKHFRPGLTDDEIYKIMLDGRTADEDGNLYTTYNDAARWDWWEVGGRWNNRLPTEAGGVNEAKIKNIKKDTGFTTYATLTPDGEWHEPGKMGYFGYSYASEEDEKKWDAEWQKRWIDNQDPELIMTIVDCHI